MQTRFINSFSMLLEIQNNYRYTTKLQEIQNKADKFISFWLQYFCELDKPDMLFLLLAL